MSDMPKKQGDSKTVAFPESKKLDRDLQKKLLEDLNNHPVRKLTKEERDIYAGAAIAACNSMPAFRDAVSLLNPYMDATCKTAYTDRFARVGVSYWFLYILNSYQRAGVILHEAMHVLNNHFVRGEVMGLTGDIMNIAGDFEINTTLDRVPQLDMCYAIFPNKGQYNFPTGLTMEQYAALLQKDDEANEGTSGPDGDSAPDPSAQGEEGEGGGAGEPSEGGSGQGQPGSGESGDSQGGPGEPGEGDGNGSSSISDADDEKSWGCSTPTDKRSASADEAGVERASAAEQSTVKANTAARIGEEIAKSRAAGNGHMEEFYRIVMDQLAPAKVDWRQIFRRVCASANDSIIRGRSDYSYRRVSRRLSGGPYIFPGMVQYVPTTMLGIDISGSMTHDDYQRTLTEAEGILKSSSKSKGGLRVFSVDTKVGNTKIVNSVKEVNLQGGGGTQMEISVAFVASLPKKQQPDIFVLATDGGTDWSAFEREALELYRKVKIIVLVTSKYGWDTVPDSLKNLITMIDVSGD